MRLAALLPLVVLVAAAASAGEPDCGDVFGFAGSARASRFSPLLPGELGVVPLVGLLEDRSADSPVAVAWEIAIRAEGTERTIRSFAGATLPEIGERRAIAVSWDGRNDAGSVVPDGAFAAVFLATRVRLDSLPAAEADRLRCAIGAGSVTTRGDLARIAETSRASTRESAFDETVRIVVDRSLDVVAAADARFDPIRSDRSRRDAPTAAKIHAPHESSPYLFWYGNPHSHSTRSDGGFDSCSGGSCNSSTAGADGAYPDALYEIAARSEATCPVQGGGLDYLMVAEHNHYFDNAFPYDTRAPFAAPGPAGAYAQGRGDADAATTPTFVAIYGMEWGTITGCNHVNVWDSPILLGWESGQYDLQTDNCRYVGSLGLYAKAADPSAVSPETGEPDLVLNHPYASEPGSFDAYIRDSYADAAVRGVAIVSGPSDVCDHDFGGGGTGETSAAGGYKDRFIRLLDAGWKVAPEAHQDNHGDDVGTHSQIRTVILAPRLSRECLLRAHRNRRFYATQDRDGQLIFTATPTSSGVKHAMGESIGGSGGVAFHASWWDDSGDELTTYRLLRGQVGGGCTSFSSFTAAGTACRQVATGTVGAPPTDRDGVSDTGENVKIDVVESPASGSWYYLVELIHQNSANPPLPDDPFARHTVSAPIFVDFGVVDSGAIPVDCPTCVASPSVAVPTGVVAAPGAASVTVTWNNVVPGGSYRVERALGGCTAGFGTIARVAAGGGATTSYVDGWVAGGTQVAYRVIADDGTCRSAPSGCGTLSATSAGLPPEVSPNGDLEQLRIRKVGAGVELRASFEGAYQYEAYGAGATAAIVAGAWTTRFCDLAGNALGSYATNSSTFQTFTLPSLASLPDGFWVVVSSLGGGEGPYGTDSLGAARARDADGTTPDDRGCLPPPACPGVVINEVDGDTPGADIAEFVELWNPGPAPVDLGAGGYVLVLFNGTTDGSYLAMNLTGTLAANGYRLIGNPGVGGVDQTFPNATLQNGADAVALYRGTGCAAALFPTDTPAATTVGACSLVDDLVYGTSDPADTGLLAALGDTEQADEDSGGNGPTWSIQRAADGAGCGRGWAGHWKTAVPTPKAAN